MANARAGLSTAVEQLAAAIQQSISGPGDLETLALLDYVQKALGQRPVETQLTPPDESSVLSLWHVASNWFRVPVAHGQ